MVTDSQATREELIERFDLDPERVDVVHLGLGMREVADARRRRRAARAGWSLGTRRCVLTVAAALPHKNLDRLLEAIARWTSATARRRRS